MSEQEQNDIMQAVQDGEMKIQYVQPRWRSWALWVSVAGAVWTIAILNR